MRYIFDAALFAAIEERDALRSLVTKSVDSNDFPVLYGVARNVCHNFGLPWTDPRTGIMYPPPKKRGGK